MDGPDREHLLDHCRVDHGLLRHGLRQGEPVRLGAGKQHQLLSLGRLEHLPQNPLRNPDRQLEVAAEAEVLVRLGLASLVIEHDGGQGLRFCVEVQGLGALDFRDDLAGIIEGISPVLEAHDVPTQDHGGPRIPREVERDLLPFVQGEREEFLTVLELVDPVVVVVLPPAVPVLSVGRVSRRRHPHDPVVPGLLRLLADGALPIVEALVVPAPGRVDHVHTVGDAPVHRLAQHHLRVGNDQQLQLGPGGGPVHDLRHGGSVRRILPVVRKSFLRLVDLGPLRKQPRLDELGCKLETCIQDRYRHPQPGRAVLEARSKTYRIDGPVLHGREIRRVRERLHHGSGRKPEVLEPGDGLVLRERQQPLERQRNPGDVLVGVDHLGPGGEHLVGRYLALAVPHRVAQHELEVPIPELGVVILCPQYGPRLPAVEPGLEKIGQRRLHPLAVEPVLGIPEEPRRRLETGALSVAVRGCIQVRPTDLPVRLHGIDGIRSLPEVRLEVPRRIAHVRAESGIGRSVADVLRPCRPGVFPGAAQQEKRKSRHPPTPQGSPRHHGLLFAAWFETEVSPGTVLSHAADPVNSGLPQASYRNRPGHGRCRGRNPERPHGIVAAHPRAGNAPPWTAGRVNTNVAP